MPKLSKETIEKIKELSTKDLQDIVIKLATKEKTVYEYVFINYLDKEQGERDLFVNAKEDLAIIFTKRHKGFSEQLQFANMLTKCIQRINEFTHVSKNQMLEAQLLLFVLEYSPLSINKMYGTCFTQFDTKVAMIVRRLINLVLNKLHEDYKIEYDHTINDFLQILHCSSNHIETVYALPNKI